jgi:hypothetical protein
MPTRDETIEVIAEHFTGALVAHHSICLSLGGFHAMMAKRFFDARDKLGIRGYDTRESAIRALRANLGERADAIVEDR